MQVVCGPDNRHPNIDQHLVDMLSRSTRRLHYSFTRPWITRCNGSRGVRVAHLASDLKCANEQVTEHDLKARPQLTAQPYVSLTSQLVSARV